MYRVDGSRRYGCFHGAQAGVDGVARRSSRRFLGAESRSGDVVEELFIQESNFYLLTGVSEPGAALILAPSEKQYKEILYLQPRDPDHENWNVRRAPRGDALEKATGFPEVRGIGRLGSDLTAMLQRSRKAAFLGPIVSATAPVPPAVEVL